MTIFSINVADGADDSGTCIPGFIFQNYDIDIKLGLIPGFGTSQAYIRFVTEIPQSSTITSALLSGTLFEGGGTTGSFKIYGADEDSSQVITDANDFLTRPKTTAESIVTFDGSETGRLSFDVTSVVQEIVNRPGFDGTIQFLLYQDSLSAKISFFSKNFGSEPDLSGDYESINIESPALSIPIFKRGLASRRLNSRSYNGF